MTAGGRAVVVAAACLLGACSGRAPAPPDPVLRSTGGEAEVAVTVPGGAETLPSFERQPERATLTVPSDLLFARGSDDLGAGAVAVLAQVVDEVRARSTSRPAAVLVEGHADGDGDSASNQALSERRAGAVASWLATHGVDPSTITTTGWGETRPAVAETDEAAKAQNRRVVVTVS